MTAEKIAKEYKFSLEGKAYSKDKAQELRRAIQEFKKVIMKTQKELNFGEDAANFLGFICDEVAEGKNISIIEETPFWNVTEASKRLGVTRPTIYKMIERGDLDAVEFEGTKIVPSSAIAFLKRKEIARADALKKLHEIDSKLERESRDILPNSNSEDDFEEIDL